MDTTARAGHGEFKIPGGKLVVVDLEVAAGRIASVQVSGDFFMEPAEALDALNDALQGLPATTSESGLSAAAALALGDGTQLYGITAGGVARAVRRALDDATGGSAGGSAAGEGAADGDASRGGAAPADGA